MARCGFVITLVMCLCAAAPCAAQGLLWSLPPDGAWVQYQGDYTQLVYRPNSTEGDLTLSWRRNLTIKSVGALDVTIEGEVTPIPCRWIEIKVETGQIVEGVIDAGPGGVRIYKLLVREDAIQGQVNRPHGEEGSIFNSYIPLVQGTTMQDGAAVAVGPGWRKTGDLPAERIEGEVFQLYPSVSLLRHYRDLAAQGNAQQVNTPSLGNVSATEYSASMEMETSGHRSTNTAEMFRSDDVPFGLLRWTATTVTEKKVTVLPRDMFEETVQISEEMNLIEAATEGAETELVTDEEF
jgi:hypothetical protein